MQARGRWQSYDLHGSIGADSPVELLQYIQEVVRQTSEFLQNTDVVLLTLGTAWAYRLRETGELVSNCHKQPADLFVRELLTPDEIINALAETHAYLRRINPELRFVLTVSPVRHLKDTLPLNAVSKSVLRVATHIVSDLLPGVAYFPAFELLTDDLRDYRFYAADMLHPSEVAEDYIWDKFARTYFDADFGRFRKEWAAVRQALGHRPLHEGAPEHRQFLESTREKLEQLALRQVDVADELRTVHARIAALPLPRLPEPAYADELEDGEERIDIGDEAPAVVATAATAPASRVVEAAQESVPAEQAGGRPPRLSPEEFRAQRAARPARGRRDGRGKSRAAQPSEAEQFQAASFAEADEFTQVPFLNPDVTVELQPVASATEATADGPEALDTAADAMEAGHKKKRRSRGGAKRTARKHALRAAEMGLQEGGLAASEAALEAAASGMALADQPETAGGSATTAIDTQAKAESGRNRRDGHDDRRRNGGRGVARVPLFAAAASDDAEAASEASATSADAGLPVAAAMPVADVTAASIASTNEAGGAESGAPVSSSRKSRNRKKKKGARPNLADGNEAFASATPATADAMGASQPLPRGAEIVVVDAETAQAAQNDGRNNRGNGRDRNRDNGRDNNRRDNQRQTTLPAAALPVGGAAAAVSATPVVLVAAASEAAGATSEAAVAGNQADSAGVSKANKPSKRKSRAMVGGRAEKPAFDTPIIPVVDSLNMPTQVAAGRLTGTSASLVEAKAPIKPGKATSSGKQVFAKAKSGAPMAKVVAGVATQTAAAPAPVTQVADSVDSAFTTPSGKNKPAIKSKPAKATFAKAQPAVSVGAPTQAAAKPASGASTVSTVPTTVASSESAPATPAPTAQPKGKVSKLPKVAGTANATEAAAATPVQPAAAKKAAAAAVAADATPVAKATTSAAVQPTKAATKTAATTKATAASAAKPAKAATKPGGKPAVAKATPAPPAAPAQKAPAKLTTAKKTAAPSVSKAAKGPAAASKASADTPSSAKAAASKAAVSKPVAMKATPSKPTLTKAAAKPVAKSKPAAPAAVTDKAPAKPATKAKAPKK